MKSEASNKESTRIWYDTPPQKWLILFSAIWAFLALAGGIWEVLHGTMEVL